MDILQKYIDAHQASIADLDNGKNNKEFLEKQDLESCLIFALCKTLIPEKIYIGNQNIRTTMNDDFNSKKCFEVVFSSYINDHFVEFRNALRDIEFLKLKSKSEIGSNAANRVGNLQYSEENYLNPKSKVHKLTQVIGSNDEDKKAKKSQIEGVPFYSTFWITGEGLVKILDHFADNQHLEVQKKEAFQALKTAFLEKHPEYTKQQTLER
jgi:hypothetical protein